MARSAQTARKPKNKNKQKKKEASEGEDNTTQEDVEMKEEEVKEEEEDQSEEEGNNVEDEETTEPEQTQEENKETTEESKEDSDKTDFHKARRTLYIHFPPGPIGESGMEMLSNIYENNGKLSLPQQVCFAAFPSEEVVEAIKPKLEEMELNGQPLTVKYMGAKGTDMDDPCINPFRIKVQGLLVHPDEKQVAKKFPTGKVTLTIKKLKSVTIDFNTKEEAREALKSAKGLKFGDKPCRVSYVREATENWMEDFLKRKAEREAADSQSPSKKQKTEVQKEDGNSTKDTAEENEEVYAELLGDEGEDDEEEDEGEGEGEGEEDDEEGGEGEESEGEGEGDEDDQEDEEDDE